MPSLDTLVSQWAAGLRESHPGVAPHVDELADHVSSRAQELVSRGTGVEEAFATALGALGTPSDLQDEFGKNHRLQRRTERRVVGVYLLATFAFTATVLVVHGVFNVDTQVTVWILVAWVVSTTPLHDFFLRRARRGPSLVT